MMELTSKNKPRKRAFKACVFCRSRKAKCEFNSPGDLGVYPCIRCQKEGQQCHFLPTRRGGNHGNGHTVRKARELLEAGRARSENHSLIAQSPHSDITRHEDSQVDVEQLTEAPLRNPSDALEILARTSPTNRYSDSDSDEDEGTNTNVNDLQHNGIGQAPDESEEVNNGATHAMISTRAAAWYTSRISTPEENHDTQALKNIENFPLIKFGLINPTQLRTYVSIFVSRHNHYLPIIPEYRLPNNDNRLGQLAAEEPFLLMVIVLIASRFEKDSPHAACWKYSRCFLSGITYGGLPNVGVVEGLLLLSENLPRLPRVADDDFHRVEAFMSWNLIGLAVRFSYFLGLDQKTLLSPSQVYDEQTSRERLAWTYCYIFDRQVSIRLGKAFWSRGPGLCFQNPPEADMNIMFEARNNFPTLALNTSEITRDFGSNQPRHTGANVGDNATLLQAYVELTQILTNIHDTLYPSRDRTIALVRTGQYYRMLDEFTRSITAFSITWENKHQWKTFPLNETIWATFQYTKLYAYSFAFQAHIQRATCKSKEKIHNIHTGETLAGLIFPRGLTGCPDAKFILEAIDSASKLLNICVNGLYNGGALAFLPSRFYGYFSYAAVFLVKVVLTGAVVSSERKTILSLVGKTITALQSASFGVDKQHLGARSARQLKTLVRTLIVATGTSLAPTPDRYSPAPPEMHQPPDLSQASNDYSLWFDELNMSPLEEPMTIPINETPFASEACAQELAALLSSDIDSDVWLSFF